MTAKENFAVRAVTEQAPLRNRAKIAMPISTPSVGAGSTASVIPTAQPASAESPKTTQLTVAGMIEFAGLDAKKVAGALGEKRMAGLQSALDSLSQMDRHTLGMIQRVHRVPASEQWRDVLGDIKTLDMREQGHVLAALSMQIQKVPDTQEKTLMMDAIADAMNELRGQSAVDALWGFAVGTGQAGSADPAFAQFVSSRE